MALRDIRPDLQERLDALKERSRSLDMEYEKKIKDLKDEHIVAQDAILNQWEALQELFEAEEERLGANRRELPQLVVKRPLDEFFIAKVAQHGQRTKKELREDAEQAGYFPNGGSGRATHTTLMNIVRAGRLLESDEDVYAPAHSAGFVLDLEETR